MQASGAPSHLPSSARLFVNGSSAPTSCSDLFCPRKTAVIFGTPGAFTPTCTNKHVPGFVSKAEELRGLGVDMIACITPNDHFVNEAWAKQIGSSGITFVSDANLEWCKGLGLFLDRRDDIMGDRFRRFALVASEGKILYFAPEETVGLDKSSAENVIAFLKRRQSGA